MLCVCGSEQFENFEKPSFVVNAEGVSLPSSVSYVRCTRCGVVRQQNLPFTNEEEYERYYEKYPPTNESYRAKDWEHDRSVARLRCDAYGINDSVCRLMLDIGSGSGAFVHECRSRNQQAYGCEIADYHYSQQHEFIYRNSLEKINFPVDHFDIVTFHDVLEHTLDPMKMLKEALRITKQQGQVIIDYPNFFAVEGAHHWKDAEHVFFFTIGQLIKLVQQAGFEVTDVRKPIPSKIVIYCQKLIETRKTVLVPPGIGDSYWSICKMQAFMKREQLDIVDVIPVSNKETKYQGHTRSIPFIKMFSFMNATGATVANDPKHKTIWNEAYALQGRTIFRNVMGYDYFISYNGHLRVGKQLEQLDPGLACNWHPSMFVSLEQQDYRESCISKYGKYFVCYFPFYGTYEYWTRQFPISEVIASINKISEQTGYTPVIVGAGWDADDLQTHNFFAQINNCVDLTNKTTLDELFGLLKGSQAVIGYPSGLTIIAAVLGVKTLILWNTYYNIDFAWYCAPPDVRKKNYFIDFTISLTSDRLSSEFIDLLYTGGIDESKFPRLFDRKKLMQPTRMPNSPPPKKTEVKAVPIYPPVDRSKEKPVTVACVLKSGGKDYTLDYVIKLRNMVARHSTVPHKFVCLSDVKFDVVDVERIPLTSNLPGWWSKLELFKTKFASTEYVVYFDLDTVLVNNIDDILLTKTNFAALGGWLPGSNRDSKENFGSGMMIWNNDVDYSFLHDEYSTKQAYRHGDQEYIVNTLIAHAVPYDTLQEITAGIYSYKRNCLAAIPVDARVICFHGRPRPSEAIKTVQWLKSYWR